MVGLNESGNGECGFEMFEKDHGGVKVDDSEPPDTWGFIQLCSHVYVFNPLPVSQHWFDI